jgi:hypothetical protein
LRRLAGSNVTMKLPVALALLALAGCGLHDGGARSDRSPPGGTGDGATRMTLRNPASLPASPS